MTVRCAQQVPDLISKRTDVYREGFDAPSVSRFVSLRFRCAQETFCCMDQTHRILFATAVLAPKPFSKQYRCAQDGCIQLDREQRSLSEVMRHPALRDASTVPRILSVTVSLRPRCFLFDSLFHSSFAAHIFNLLTMFAI